MIFTKTLGLTQYEMHDKISFLDRYNKDMAAIDINATSVSSAIIENVERIDKRIDDVVTTTSIINGEVERLDRELQEQNSRLSTVEQQANDLFITTTSISSALIEHIANSTSIAAGILEEVKDGYKELNGKIIKDAERIAVNETAIVALDEKMENIDKDKAEIEADVEELTGRISGAESNISQLQTKTSNLSTRLTNDEGKIQTNETAISNLKSRVTTAEENIEEFKNKKMIEASITYALTEETGPGSYEITEACGTLTLKTFEGQFCAVATISTLYQEQTITKNTPIQFNSNTYDIELQGIALAIIGETTLINSDYTEILPMKCIINNIARLDTEGISTKKIRGFILFGKITKKQ